jgi:uncharacterized membrane protein YesL
MVLVMSIAWYFPAMFAVILGLGLSPMSLPVFVAIVAPLTAAVTYAGNLAVHKEDAGPRDLLRGFGRFWLRAAMLGAVQSVVLVVLALDISLVFTVRATWVMMLSGIWVYLAIFIWSVCVYVYPLMVEQDVGVPTAIRRSALLVLDNPAYTLATVTIAAALFLLGVLPTVLLLLGFRAAGFLMILGLATYAGLNSIFVNCATVRVLKRYNAHRMSERERLEEELAEGREEA